MFNKRFIPLISTALLLFSCGGNTDGTLKMNKAHEVLIEQLPFNIYTTKAISLKVGKKITVKFDCPAIPFSGESNRNITIVVLKEIPTSLTEATLFSSTIIAFDELLEFKIEDNNMVKKNTKDWDYKEEFTYCYMVHEKDNQAAIYATGKNNVATITGSLSFISKIDYKKAYIGCWGFTKK